MKQLTGMLIGVLSVLLVTFILNSQAAASCASVSKLSDLAAFSKSLPLTPRAPLTAPIVTAADDNAATPSIVGFWHVHYYGPLFPGGDMEAFQIFNAGGTEVHNPNTPTDGVCLGVWVQTANVVKLTHRVWLYDPAGNFIAVGHLEANIALSDRGNTQTGTLTMQLFGLNGIAFTPPIPGTLSGERIVPNQ